MNFRKLAVVGAALCLSAGFGVGVALAGDSTAPATAVTDCSVQAGQNGINEEGTANDVQAAADAVSQEADNPQADDQAGDQQGPNDQSNEAGESNQCGDQGAH